MSEEEVKLNKYNFVRIHQGFLVNMLFVKQFLKDKIVLSNGTQIEVSNRRRKEVLLRYVEYIERLG